MSSGFAQRIEPAIAGSRDAAAADRRSADRRSAEEGAGTRRELTCSRSIPIGCWRSIARAPDSSRRRKGYSGWDADGRQLTGHIAGHHLSAVSLMWAATGDPRFKERADYIVNEMKVVPGQARRRLCGRAAA